jgi:hypothetical protein
MVDIGRVTEPGFCFEREMYAKKCYVTPQAAPLLGCMEGDLL